MCRCDVPIHRFLTVQREGSDLLQSTCKQQSKRCSESSYDSQVKTDLRLLALRGAFDPKRFYRNPDATKFPKYFQMGTVVEGPADFYSGETRDISRFLPYELRDSLRPRGCMHPCVMSCVMCRVSLNHPYCVGLDKVGPASQSVQL